MASASSGGAWSAIGNKPELPEGFSASRIAAHITDTWNGLGRLDFKNSLNQYNANGGFYDPLVDTSKVVSTSDADVITGSYGHVELGIAATGTTESAGGGNYYDNSNYSMDMNISGMAIVSEINVEGGSGGNVTFTVKDGGGSTLAEKTVSTSSSTNKTVTFSISDYSRVPTDETITITTSGNTVKYSDVTSAGGNLYGLSGGRLFYSGSSNDNVVFEDIDYPASGTVKWSSFQFTDDKGNVYTPSKVYFDAASYTLNGQEFDLVLYNSSDNEIARAAVNSSTVELAKEFTVSPTDNQFYLQAEPVSNGSGTPIIEAPQVYGV